MVIAILLSKVYNYIVCFTASIDITQLLVVTLLYIQITIYVLTGVQSPGDRAVCPLLPFKMDCNFRFISIDNFLFIFTFYVKLAIAKLVRDIKNGGKPLSLFCVYILPLKHRWV